MGRDNPRAKGSREFARSAGVEPQWTVTHKGDGLPKFTVFFGLNLTLGK